MQTSKGESPHSLLCITSDEINRFASHLKGAYCYILPAQAYENNVSTLLYSDFQLSRPRSKVEPRLIVLGFPVLSKYPSLDSKPISTFSFPLISSIHGIVTMLNPLRVPCPIAFLVSRDSAFEMRRFLIGSRNFIEAAELILSQSHPRIFSRTGME